MTGYQDGDPVPFDADPSDALAEKLAWEDAALHEWNRAAHEVAKEAKRLLMNRGSADEWTPLANAIVRYERALRAVSGEGERDG